MMAWVGAMAQKSYVYMYHDQNSYKTTFRGDVPSDMLGEFIDRDYNYDHIKVLNMLAERGYEVEFVINSNQYILSKKSSAPASAITRTKSDDGEEAYEVARYNLQGVPVSKNEKGVQIIVYSNYTTKTVIVE